MKVLDFGLRPEKAIATQIVLYTVMRELQEPKGPTWGLNLGAY